MNQVAIDFVAGSHGQYLEFVCNKFIAKLPHTDYNPFNALGASHSKSASYHKEKIFLATHYSNYGLDVLPTVIRIKFEIDDLLNLSSVSLLRAADVGIDNDLLEHNTYHKLKNKFYIKLLEQISQAYPEIQLCETQPNCPRYVLREFFKFGFKDPNNHGLVQLQTQMVYDPSHKVFDFDFKTFYDTNMFVQSMEKLAQWLGSSVSNLPALTDLHHEFLQKQIYKNSKTEADMIVEHITQKRNTQLPKLSLLQESYINAMLENLYSVEMPFFQPVYFSSTNAILKHIHK